MGNLDKKRKRNQTISFRMSPEERRELEARILVSGMPKGMYMIESLLHQELNIVAGKYQRDRLSLELKRLRQALDTEKEPEQFQELLEECKALLEQLRRITVGTHESELEVQRDDR